MRLFVVALLLSAASAKVYFSEEFNDGWRERWVDSKWKSSEGSQGTFTMSAGKVFGDEKRDSGLKTAEDARFFTTSTAFDKFSNEGKTLVLQYQVKQETDIECGGSYVKLGPKPDDLTTFGDPTKYNIMFGPDQCGYNKRVHLIFHYKGKNLLKKTDIPWGTESSDKLSHLLTLVLKADNTYQVLVDQKEKAAGKLEEDFDFLAPVKINDPAVSKPSDWVDEKKIDDPADKKPEDWVEEKQIADPEAKKPEDWDDEEDGEWEPPMKDNPAYKGEWRAKRIDNPAYKGEWVHPQIDNPEYAPDDSLYKFEDFSFIGFDLWQVKGGTIFDNLILTDSLEEANELAERTFKPLREVEDAKKKEDDAAAAADVGGDDEDDDDSGADIDEDLDDEEF